MTVGGMDADIERTRKYLQRVMSEGYPLPLLGLTLNRGNKNYVTQCRNQHVPFGGKLYSTH